jgi:uncharacterized integral membrane protein
MVKTALILLIALVQVAAGFFLAAFSEADDAPGGVVMAIIVVIGAVILAVMAVQRHRGLHGQPSQPERTS